MLADIVDIPALKLARDYAGGVSYLSQYVGVSATDLDAMLHGQATIPPEVKSRIARYIRRARIQPRRTFFVEDAGPGFGDVRVSEG